jgi:hypothetical protein
VRAWIVAMKSRSAKAALEGAAVYFTQREAAKEHRGVFSWEPDRWEVREVEVRLLPRSKRRRFPSPATEAKGGRDGR